MHVTCYICNLCNFLRLTQGLERDSDLLVIILTFLYNKARANKTVQNEFSRRFITCQLRLLFQLLARKLVREHLQDRVRRKAILHLITHHHHLAETHYQLKERIVCHKAEEAAGKVA